MVDSQTKGKQEVLQKLSVLRSWVGTWHAACVHPAGSQTLGTNAHTQNSHSNTASVNENKLLTYCSQSTKITFQLCCNLYYIYSTASVHPAAEDLIFMCWLWCCGCTSNGKSHSVSSVVTLVVLMINKAMPSAGKDLTVDPRSISYPRNCFSAEDSW